MIGRKNLKILEARKRKIASLSLLLILAICIISFLLEFYNLKWYHSSNIIVGKEQVLITQDDRLTEISKDAPCEARFCDTMEGNQRKIESYNSSQAEPYFQRLRLNGTMKAFFKGNSTDHVEIPVLVGAASSNHFHEAFVLFENLNEFVRPAYPTTKFYFYDLGLKANEAHQIREVCNCEVITFPFDLFPPHVRHLFAFCWKPLVIKYCGDIKNSIFAGLKIEVNEDLRVVTIQADWQQRNAVKTVEEDGRYILKGKRNAR